MAKGVRPVLDACFAVLADRLFQLLLLGVVGAGFFFTLVLNADLPIVAAVLVLGGLAAFLESAHHRKK
jgi:hypothetical protein